MARHEPDALVLRRRPARRHPEASCTLLSKDSGSTPQAFRGRRDGRSARWPASRPCTTRPESADRGRRHHAVTGLGTVRDVGNGGTEVVRPSLRVPLRHAEGECRRPARRAGTGRDRAPRRAHGPRGGPPDRQRQRMRPGKADHQVADHQQRLVDQRQQHDGRDRHDQPARREQERPLAREQSAMPRRRRARKITATTKAAAASTARRAPTCGTVDRMCVNRRPADDPAAQLTPGTVGGLDQQRERDQEHHQRHSRRQRPGATGSGPTEGRPARAPGRPGPARPRSCCRRPVRSRR